MNIPLKDFLGDGICLLIEPSASFSANIMGALQEIGIPFAQIATSRRFHEAAKFITEKKPKFVVMEYDIPEGHAMSLIEMIESHHSENDRIVIVVTKNSSDSAVAESAEGSVDAFILKPFSIEVFRKKLGEILEKKKHPSDYAGKIFEGRKALAAKDYDSALKLFNQAKELDPQPTMAHYFIGETYFAQGRVTDAIKEFRAGRAHNPIHYKCLVREFDLLMLGKSYSEAYELVGPLRTNYPISANRLGQIFVAAVYSRHFDDISSLYELYLNVDTRTPQLLELVALALFTAGRYWTQKREFDKAIPFFELGLTVKGRDLGFLAKIVDELLREGADDPADQILSMALPTDVGSKTLNALKFRVDRQKLEPEKLIEKGRRLIADNQATPEIYLIVLNALVDQDRLRIAEGVVAKALMEYPDMRTELYRVLEKRKAN